MVAADVIVALRDHCDQLFLPSNRGWIGVLATDYGYIATFGTYSIFLRITLEDAAIRIQACWPAALRDSHLERSEFDQAYKEGRHAGRVAGKPLPKEPKTRNRAIKDLISHSQTAFDSERIIPLADPDALNLIKFYGHNIISRIRYTVSHRSYHYVRKPDVELKDLFELATADYTRQLHKR